MPPEKLGEPGEFSEMSEPIVRATMWAKKLHQIISLITSSNLDLFWYVLAYVNTLINFL